LGQKFLSIRLLNQSLSILQMTVELRKRELLSEGLSYLFQAQAAGATKLIIC
jgi:hypothetical protein